MKKNPEKFYSIFNCKTTAYDKTKYCKSRTKLSHKSISEQSEEIFHTFSLCPFPFALNSPFALNYL